MVKVLIEKDSYEKDLLRLKDFSWPFTVSFVEKGEYDASLSADGLRLKISKDGLIQHHFSWKKRLYKWKHDKTPNTNLIKALGTKPGDSVVDATLGFGDDSSFMLSRGLKVHSFERLPELYFMHQGSLLVEELDNIDLTLSFGAAADKLTHAKAIYFDPMYDEGKERKAAARKEMSYLHHKVGGDEDAVLQGARLREMCERLVVKRPPKAPDLLENKNASWKTKAVRFDLYL